MKIKSCLILITVALSILGIDGFVQTAGAVPDDSQRLRGMAGRTFAVDVTDLATGDEFTNCYGFAEDGIWDDPLFPVQGTWSQNSTGATTSYSASAVLPIGGGLGVLLAQEGRVTPAGGRGVLQLEARSTVSIIVIADGSLIAPLAEFLSVGEQDNDCTL